jgi:DNA recombination protein RmuC
LYDIVEDVLLWIIERVCVELGKHIAAYDQYMQSLGSSLGTTVNHFNRAHKELKKIDKDVMRIAADDGIEIEASVNPLILEKPVTDEE